ncbi:MAG TPA: response regulator transcription factor [Nitrospira sp.]
MLPPFTTDTIRIVVADDFSPFREALRKFFDGFAAIEIVGEAIDGSAAIEMTLLYHPDVIIMDVKMPRLGGVEATRRIKRMLPEVHVVGISSQDDTITKEAMALAGCSAFVTKECAHTLPSVIAQLTGKHIGDDSTESVS